MKYSYQLEEKDLLAYQVYTASKSERINRKKKAGRIIMTIIALFLVLNFYSASNTMMTIYFSIVAIGVWVFYPRYFKWRYTKLYSNFIVQNYSTKIGEEEIIEIDQKSIFIKDNTGEGKFDLSEVESLIEVQEHLYIKLNIGTALVTPKDQVTNYQEVINKFKSLNLPIVDETNWKWI
ncbi:MAG: hypothetical protein ACPGVI_03480 [Crocinitomicaceae bacterium]